jgi:hypothetical protein
MWTAIMAKDFIIAKTFRAYSTNFFRQDKSLRDHGGSVTRVACHQVRLAYLVNFWNREALFRW